MTMNAQKIVGQVNEILAQPNKSGISKINIIKYYLFEIQTYLF